jgi:hypothetical protein
MTNNSSKDSDYLARNDKSRHSTVHRLRAEHMYLTVIQHHIGTIVFVFASFMTALSAYFTKKQQNKYYSVASKKFERLSNKELDNNETNLYEISRNFNYILLMLGILFLLYPFLYKFFPNVQNPYLLRVMPQYGMIIQVVVGVTIWAPALALILTGLTDSYLFFENFVTNLEIMNPEVNIANESAVRGLLDESAGWFFTVIQTLLLAWGIVGGIGVYLVFFARDELFLIIAAASSVVILLSYIFLRPLLVFATWLAARSNAVQNDLQEQLINSRVQVITQVANTKQTNIQQTISNAKLQDVISSLPPANAWQLLWEQSIKTLVALLGPFVSVLAKILQII